MAQNLLFDPVKKDYVVVDGSPSAATTINEAVYFALSIPQGAWLYGQPGQGSLLYTLANQKRTSSIEQTYSAYATQSIKTQLIDNNLASASQVGNFQATSTGTSNKIEVQPLATGLSDQLNFNSVK